MALYRKGKQTAELTLKSLSELVDAIKSIVADPNLISGGVGLLPFMAELKEKLLPLAKKILELELEK